MKDIVIISNFSGSLSESGNGRFTYICRELSKNNNVELITSDFSHRKKERRSPLAEELPFKVTFVHEPGYKKNVSLRRFYSHFVWGLNVKRYLEGREAPDVIYCAIPSLTAALYASEYCKGHNVKLIIDIQDLWPEAFKMVFNVPIVSDLIFLPFTVIANKIYSSADGIIAVSDTYVERALSVNKKCSVGHTVFIGTRLETFDEGAVKDPLFRKPSGEIWLGYCGSLSVSYDIPTLIKAVRLLSEKGISSVKLIIMGDGAYRQQYEALASDEGVDAVFTGRLPYDIMCAQLKECDVALNPIKGGSAASIINKHSDYAASGLPVLNSQDSDEYRKLIDDYGMGISCKNGDPADMAQKLEMLILDEKKRIAMGQNARRCAEEKFDRKSSYAKIYSIILE